MTALLAFILTNKTILGIFAAVLGALGFGMYQRNAGARAERDKQARDRLDSIKDKQEKDDEVDGLGHADLDTHFQRWLRDGNG